MFSSSLASERELHREEFYTLESGCSLEFRGRLYRLSWRGGFVRVRRGCGRVSVCWYGVGVVRSGGVGRGVVSRAVGVTPRGVVVVGVVGRCVVRRCVVHGGMVVGSP